jgi:hypothetical protein
VYLGFQNQSFSVHQEVALVAADLLLAAIVTALLSAYPGRLRGLRIDDPCTGLSVSPREYAQVLAQRSIQPPQIPSMRQLLNQWYTVLQGGKSQGTKRHGQPLLST